MSTYLLPIAIVTVTVIGMEGFAWWMHRYVMHGFGWSWHKSHHQPDGSFFEKNDLFFVVFAALSMIFFTAGNYWAPVWWVGAGVAVYGFLYFVFHDCLVHQRWPFRYHPKSGYLRRIVEAHHLHHAVNTKDDCVAFNLIYAPDPDKFREQLKQMKKAA